MTDAPVRFEERGTRCGQRIGVATLDAPKTLNGLSLVMASMLLERLDAWARDPGVVVVMLQGAGEKAFCAGGDLHSLYSAMKDGDTGYASDFFAAEYRLDYTIHTYVKPVLCMGHGVVMGGGLGLMAGASHRVVTERSRLAFPEITIGLYPDVAGSYLLNRVPGYGGRFLGLSGASMDAGDAMYAGLADVMIDSGDRQSLDAALLDTSWSRDPREHGGQLTALLGGVGREPAIGPLQRFRSIIDEACRADDLATVVQSIQAIASDDPWLKTARQTSLAGSPGSARLAFEAQRRAVGASLADVFRMEYLMSVHCAAHGDFAEGIRALLIDKDRAPRWNPASLAEATAEWARPFFEAPPTQAMHPLHDIGGTMHPTA